MQELYDALAAQAEQRAKAWTRILGPEGLLDRGTRELIRAGDDPGGEGLAESVWGLFRRDEEGGVCAGLAGLCRPGSSYFPGADAARLYGNALSHFAAGMSVYWAGRLTSGPAAAAEMALWLSRAAGLPEGRRLTPAGGLDNVAWAAEVGARLRQILDALPADAGFSRARLWLRLRAWEPDGLAEPAADWQVRVPFACYRERQDAGHVFDLRLRRLSGGPRELIEAPENWNRALTADWLAVLEEAFQTQPFSRPVVWSITPRVPPGASAAQMTFPLAGLSHTAAARASFQVLRESGDYDDACLLAALVENGDLKKVHGLEAKCRAAVEVGVRRVVIAQKAPLDRTKIQDILDRHPELVVEHVNLADAVHEATGLASGLRRYLKWVAALPDRDPPRYLAGRTLSKLYVEPEVNSGRVRLDGDEKGGGPIERTVLDADSDAELHLHYQRFGRQRDRVRWEREWPKARRAVIVGFPGEGKTILAKMTAKALAEQGERELTGRETAATEVTLPVFVRLAELAEHGSLEAVVESGLPPKQVVNLHPRFVKHLRDSLRSASTWLILDGLDEVPEGKRPAVKAILETLRDAECRVVVTSRPYGYRRGELPFASVSEYELAPLSPTQRRRFLEAWFQHDKDDGLRDRVRELIDGHASLREVGRNALLLTLACAESELRRLDPKTTRRVHLFYWAVRDLMRGAWQKDPQPEDDVLQAEYETLRELAWDLFQSNPAGVIFEDERLTASLNRQEYNRIERVELLSKWRKQRGLLLSGIAPDTKRAGTFFLHRSFLEFLAADHVAHLPDPATEVERYLWRSDGRGGWVWTPDAQSFLRFVAGEMARPAELLGRLVREHERLPDALGVMLRLAGNCLAEVDTGAVPEALQRQVIEEGCFRLWLELGCTVGAAQALASRRGVDVLIHAVSSADSPAAVRENAAAALGALADQRAIEPLLHVFHDDTDEEVQTAAARALGLLGGERAGAALLAALHDDRNWYVQGAAAEALGMLGDMGVVQPLLDVLRRPSESYIRAKAARALGMLGDVRAVEPMLIALNDPHSWQVREAAARALGALGDVRAVKSLSLVLQQDPDDNVRCAAGAALRGLVPFVDDRLIQPLLRALGSTEGQTSRAAAGGLEGLAVQGDGRVIEPLLHTLVQGEGHVRRAAARALGTTRDGRAVKPLIDALQGDLHWYVKEAAARALGALGDRQAVDALLYALKNASPWHVCRAAARALGMLEDDRAVEPLLYTLRAHDFEFVRGEAAVALERFLNSPYWFTPSTAPKPTPIVGRAPMY